MKSILILLITLCSLSSCLTQKKILQKAEQLTDTTYVTKVETITIPKDSVIIRTKTDTSRVLIRERQGRATVTLIRTPVETIAKAECDTIIREVRVTVPCPPQLIIGVNKWWRVAAIALGGLLVMSFMLIVTFLAGVRYTQKQLSKQTK